MQNLGPPAVRYARQFRKAARRGAHGWVKAFSAFPK